MGKCVNHPDRETSYMCSKHGIYLCEECLECRDPEIYCKFRSACPIWYEHKRKARKARQEAALEKADTCKVTFQPDNKTVQVAYDEKNTLGLPKLLKNPETNKNNLRLVVTNKTSTTGIILDL